MSKLIVAPVLIPGQNIGNRIALVFNGEELPLANHVKVARDNDGRLIITAIWVASDEVEVKSFINESDIPNL